ncbi:hypothetical protein DN404_00700 [Bacillus sp. TE8-1]|nr:hypothetical protein DN404_00700 [Bacillus sp. TE8-1]
MIRVFLLSHCRCYISWTTIRTVVAILKNRFLVNIGCLPLFLAWLVKVILMRFMRESIGGRLAYLSCLFFMYYVFKFVTE